MSPSQSALLTWMKALMHPFAGVRAQVSACGWRHDLVRGNSQPTQHRGDNLDAS
jgi:hypothetical protein